MESKALWHLTNDQSEILDTPLPAYKTETFEIQTLYSFVSLGTERLVAKGEVPLEMYQEMAVPFMEGTFHFPVKYGYSLVGRVVSNQSAWDGKVVHLLHPHQNKCRVPPSAFSAVPLDIPPQRAVLASNLETVVTAIWDAEVSIGDRVAILGFGTIGALLCRVLSKFPGIELSVYENHPARSKLAKEMGFQLANSAQVLNKFDLSFNASGSEEGLQFCLDHTGQEGRVVELSWYGTRAVQIKLGKYFHNRRLQLISSQVAHIPARRSARWDYQRRKQTVFNLLRDPDFDLHLTNRVPFERAPALFEDMRNGPLEGIGYYLSY